MYITDKNTILALYEAHTVEEANEKLNDGWKIYRIFGNQEKRVYFLALFGQIDLSHIRSWK